MSVIAAFLLGLLGLFFGALAGVALEKGDREAFRTGGLIGAVCLLVAGMLLDL